ncbi:hypothetical protein [Nonomuraea sp. NPDC049725]|uniref:hypothetical protein n=1 Tax=Nonomuraea sp. NPDC049725 TaxID=3154508 RepID=UPI003437A448
MFWETDDEHGRHVPAGRAEELSIVWTPEAVRPSPVRVRDYSCPCQVPYYELCQAEGVRFIRMVHVNGDESIVDESPRDRAPKVDELWARLLTAAVPSLRDSLGRPRRAVRSGLGERLLVPPPALLLRVEPGGRRAVHLQNLRGR